jgi:periplasmic protein TonB
MVYPQRAQNLVKQGTVVIQFIVNKEGHVISPAVAQSVEYSLDQEALRLIKQSPVWNAAMQDGEIVKSYKKQPVTFRLE